MIRVSFGSLASQGRLLFSDGYRTKGSELASAGFRILRAGDIQDGQPVFESPDYVHYGLASGIGGKTVQAGDVVLTTKGTVGRTAFVKKAPDTPAVYSPQLCFFRPDSHVLLAEYLYFWFSSPEFRHQSSGLQSSTDMAPYISLSQLKGVTITLPPPNAQQAVAEVLGALDDKIAANTHMADTSDALVRTMYASLPPSSTSLGELCVNVREQVQPNSRVPYVGLEHVGRKHLWLHDQGTSDEVTSAKSVFQAGDVLFGKLRPYFHKVVSAPVGGICSTDILVLRAKDPQLAGYVLAAAGSTQVVDHSTARSAGTKMPRASWADLSEAPIRWAGRDAAHRLSKIVTAVREATEAAIRESQTLAQLRDTLLPALMDGRLRVRDAIAQAEDRL